MPTDTDSESELSELGSEHEVDSDLESDLDEEDALNGVDDTVPTPRLLLFELPPSSPPRVSPTISPHRPLIQEPSSDPGVDYSSPVRGRGNEYKLARRAKNRKHASQRMSQLYADQREAAVLEAEKQKKFHPHRELFYDILARLRAAGATFGDLFFFIMDPTYQQGKIRYHHFLGTGDSVSRALELIHRATPTVRQKAEAWTINRVVRSIQREARATTKLGILQTHKRKLGYSFFMGFDLAGVTERIAVLMPTATRMLTALASNPRNTLIHGPARVKRRSNVVFTSLFQGMSEWSQKNNLFKKIMSLYMYATGAQRQQIEVLSHIGISETYSGLVDKRKKKKRKNKKKAVIATPASAVPPSTEDVTADDLNAIDDEVPVVRGTVRQLSEDLKANAQRLADKVLFGGIYDNVNWIWKTAEQIVGRRDAQQNGTCATIYALWKAQLEDMKAADLIAAFDTAGPLQLDDILHSESESKQFRQFLIFTILRIIISEGGKELKRFAPKLSQRQPSTEDKIDVHKTEIQPTPAWNIDQSTISGNAEFVEAFYEYLGLRTSSTFSTWVRLLAGDQLSIARLRSLLNIRAGQEGGANGFRNFVLVPGLFHAKIADTHGFFATHWGKAGKGPRAPGSLWFHNTILQRLPITPTSLPSFRTCRDLIFVSLYARILDCLLIVTNQTSLEDVIDETTTFDDLLIHATAIYDQFLDVDRVHELRSERESCVDSGGDPAKQKKGDMVFENAVLFLRDALISREYADAIKAGDSGRVLLVLKIWALSYRGNGRSKYAYEMLSLMHNVSHVWPKPIVKIVMNNWLVNTEGNPNSFLECDLLQEHMNFWIKNFYRAHGSNASWEWLEMLAPCVVVLRGLTKSLNGLLGANLGTKHKSPELAKDIKALMDRLREFDVHSVQQGRVIDPEDGGPVTDVISAGLAALTDATSNPLNEYNAAFTRLQARCCLPTLIGQSPAPPASALRPPATSESTQTPFDASDPTSASLAETADTIAIPEEPEPEEPVVDDESVLFIGDSNSQTLTLEEEEDVALDMDELDLGVSHDDEACSDSDSESDA